MAVTAAGISRWSSLGIVILLALTLGSVVSPVHAADDGFTRFLAAVWPEAQQAGVSRATFDSVTAGLEPDYKLPDLILPGRPATGAPSQAELWKNTSSEPSTEIKPKPLSVFVLMVPVAIRIERM